MPSSQSSVRNEREVGRVVSVSSYRLTVRLDEEVRSQVRAYGDRITVVTQIGGYLVFPVGPGENVIGIIVGASEDENVEPDEERGMTLQLKRFRKTLRLNLLGQLFEDRPFVAGVSVYPTLDTPALLPTESELKRILEFVPLQTVRDEDVALPLGVSPIYARQDVTGSYNDLLSRHLGIIGNTGSGKSYSVASIIQRACSLRNEHASHAKFIVLDINGEYTSAFKLIQSSLIDPPRHELNRVYIGAEIFNLPLWVFNLAELIEFFEASQASQVPVLERVIASVREESIDPKSAKVFRQRVRLVDQCLDCLDGLSSYANELTGSFVSRNASAVLERLEERMKVLNAELEIPEMLNFEDAAKQLRKAGLGDAGPYNCLTTDAVTKIEELNEVYKPELEKVREAAVTEGGLIDITADSPVPFDASGLERDALFQIAVSRFRGQERIQEYIATLRLRIHRQLSDKRWNVFTTTTNDELYNVFQKVCGSKGDRITVIDCSMLSYDVLPFFCAVIGRLLLDLRSHSTADERILQPFVLVLEEAHNYLKPHREDESRGIRVSRDAFERIAKEGRKFGLSLIIASQRPSDVSPTVLSQCANFLVHRIQNPEDIDYFRKILPTGSRDLLDQLPILAPGDGLCIGSAFNVPARIKIATPNPLPASETPKPWKSWQQKEDMFDIKKSVESWTRY